MGKILKAFLMNYFKMANKNYNREIESRVLKQYFKEIANHNPLTREREQYLSTQILGETEDRDKSIEELVCSNLKFGIKIAMDYTKRGIPLEDLISHANIGLVNAAKRFDGRMGYKFITYAVWYIKQNILKAVGEENEEIKIPYAQIRYNNNINRFKQKFFANNGRYPSFDEISKNLKIKDCNIENYRYSKKKIDSFDEGEKEKDLLYNRVISDCDSPDDGIINKQFVEKLNEVLDNNLTDREKSIIEMKYGLNGFKERLTLKEIGKVHGVSRERIRQIKERALEKIRENSDDLLNNL